MINTPTSHDLIDEAWTEALNELADLGTTDRWYGDGPREAEVLWYRAARLYAAAVRRYPNKPGIRELPGILVKEIRDEYAVLLGMVRQAYAEQQGTRRVDMDRVARLLRKMGHDQAYVEYTGGGCATLYSGNTWRDEDGEKRQHAVFGPGQFYGPGWTEPYASPAELYVGRDDDGTSTHHKLPAGATDDEIAKIMHLQIHASRFRPGTESKKRAMIGLAAAVQQVRNAVTGRMRWGMRITDDQCELLTQQEPAHVGGEADWRIAVYLYELTEDVVTDDLLISAGAYLRVVEGKNVQAFSVPDVPAARDYVWAIKDEFDVARPRGR